VQRAGAGVNKHAHTTIIIEAGAATQHARAASTWRQCERCRCSSPRALPSFRAHGARSARGSERGVLGEQPREDVAELATEHRGGL
jgi:hypothetical protein